MKIAALSFTMFVLLAGCGKKEAVWNELSDADKLAITQRAEKECLAESKADFADFKEKSADVYSSGDWEKGDGWLHILKNTTTSPATEDRRHTILVWKRTSTDLYLVVTRSINSDTLTYFLRIPKADNTQMIADIQTSYCKNKFKMTTSSSLGTAKVEYEKSDTEGNKDLTDTHTFNYNYPAFVGTIWNFARVQITTDSDNKKTTKKFTSTFSRISNPDDLEDDFMDYDDDLFCDLPATFALPSTFEPDAATCSQGAPPGGWSL